MNSEFVPVNGYEDLYQLNKNGDILSLRSNKKLKISVGKEYAYVTLRNNNNTTKMCSIHRLLAENFIENPQNKPQVHHIDHDKNNFNLDNLEWVDPSENMKKARDFHKQVIPVKQYSKDGNFIAEYKSATEAFEKTGVNHAHIRQCCNKKTHYNTAGGYKWENVISEDHSYGNKKRKRNVEKYVSKNGEIFKNIGIYNNTDLTKYKISNFGTILNEKGFRIQTRLTYDGYEVVTIKQCFIRCHRLVTTQFLPDPLSEQNVVNHIDENKSNNYVGNLEWTTNSENETHSCGKSIGMFDKNNGNLLKTFVSIHEANRYLGKCISGKISGCCNGKQKTAHGFTWKWTQSTTCGS